MWLVIIFIVSSVASFFLIYKKLNTKNVIDYHPNGRVKFIGVTEFSKRVGIFESFDEDGRKICEMLYEQTGKLSNILIYQLEKYGRP
jgi:antitoxin component YwqK of YwqJK toxin-antitoxin module